MRIMALDVGDKTIGVAVSDELQMTYAERVHSWVKRSALSGALLREYAEVDATASPRELIKKHERRQS